MPHCGYSGCTNEDCIPEESVAMEAKLSKSDEISIQELRSSPTFDTIKPFVRLGFELETQESEGETSETLESSGNNDDRDDWVSERIDELNWGTVIGDAGLSLTSVQEGHLIRWLNANDIDISSNIVDDWRDHYSEQFDEENLGRRSPSDVFRSISGLQVGYDSSVDGFEFRTVGPQTYARVKEQCEEVFTMNHIVDTECSFHVHLSVRGVSHSRSDAFQTRLVNALFNCIHMFPSSALGRLTNLNQMDRYYAPGGTDEKMSMVHKHPQGTWEFRLFGNISNAEDGQKCIDIAVESYLSAVSTSYTPPRKEQHDFLLAAKAELDRRAFGPAQRQA